MAKRTNAPVCDRCETPFRSAIAFCSGCGGPTPWATHEDRVQWEVRQWRASRASAGNEHQQMMLVRTETGYEPMPLARQNGYVWDQPLHPERGTETVDPAPGPQRAAVTPPVAGPRPAETPVPQAPDASPAAVVQPPVIEQTHGAGNGNSNGNPYANGHPAVQHPDAEPAPDAAVEPGPRPPIASETTRQHPAASVPGPAPATVSRPPLHASFDPDERVTISKKAVALGIAIALGLPFGGRIVGLVDGGPSTASRIGTVAGPARPAPLVAARSGFTQAGPDAVRYAVVIKNPNRGLQASGVTVSVALHDARGRLVGRDTENVVAVPAAGALGLAGAVGVSGPASKLTVKLAGTTFHETAPAKPFAVRGVRLSRSGGSFVVRATVSGVLAVKGARVVAVHLDRRGRVLGGDFTYLDVPRSPRSASAVVSTAAVPRSVVRVEVYVLP